MNDDSRDSESKIKAGIIEAFSAKLDRMFNGNHPWFEKILKEGIQKGFEAWLDRNSQLVISYLSKQFLTVKKPGPLCRQCHKEIPSEEVGRLAVDICCTCYGQILDAASEEQFEAKKNLP